MNNFWRFFIRVAISDPRKIELSAGEVRALDAAQVMEPLARRFAVWRRSVLWIAGILSAIAAFASFGNGIEAYKTLLTPFGVVLIGYVLPLASLAIPFGALGAAIRYTRPSDSSRVLVAAAAVSIGVPLAVMFIPIEYLARLEHVEGLEPGYRELTRGVVRTLVGVVFYITLVPTVLSLLSAISRACVQVKMFIPESVVPGWGLVTSVPLTVLLSLAAFVLLYHTAGNWLLLAGVVLMVGAPMIYLTRFEELTKPISATVALGLRKTGRWTFGATILGGGCLLAFLFTATLFGKALVGLDERGSWFQIWSWDLLAKLAEYLGRSLFLTVLFADLLVRMSLSVWLEERAFFRGEEAKAYDSRMTGLGMVAACEHLSAEIKQQPVDSQYEADGSNPSATPS